MALGHGGARRLATLQRRLAADLALRIHGAAIGSGDVGGLVEAFRETGPIQRLAGAFVPAEGDGWPGGSSATGRAGWPSAASRPAVG